ncbi:MAG: ABC transporter permease [Casimicrobiaceae bacterium]
MAVYSDALRATASIFVFLATWEAMSNVTKWFGVEMQWAKVIPPPTTVLKTWIALLGDPDYWHSWYLSTYRVATGFVAAMVFGIPLGLAMAVSKTFRGISFPVFEVLRPIPPLAWVPASIIFWPTQELSVIFVIFLGAFTTVVINVLGGARAIDIRFIQSAQAMGSSGRDIFRRIILPHTIPSIVVGGEVGMGITWAIVVAAEMIAGGGSSLSGRGAGLGYFIWNAYVNQSFPEIIVGMFSIGAAGFAASAVLRRVGRRLTPWLQVR